MCLEMTHVKRAGSSAGTEPSMMSSSASRPQASPLHIPAQAEEIFKDDLSSSGGFHKYWAVLMGSPQGKVCTGTEALGWPFFLPSVLSLEVFA